MFLNNVLRFKDNLTNYKLSHYVKIYNMLKVFSLFNKENQRMMTEYAYIKRNPLHTCTKNKYIDK